MMFAVEMTHKDSIWATSKIKTWFLGGQYNIKTEEIAINSWKMKWKDYRLVQVKFNAYYGMIRVMNSYLISKS